MYDANVAVLGAVVTAPTIVEAAGVDLAYTGSSTANLIIWAVSALIAGAVLLRAARPALLPPPALHAGEQR